MTQRPSQQIHTHFSNGAYFVSLSTEGSSNTFYLNYTDAIDLMLSLKNTLEGNDYDFGSHLLAIKNYKETGEI